ncbi:hypothetical protein Q8F55_006609 [Vanrija albida]|uniref:Uncharacterized protein n=1 Tax=Vanrija albida TaxID=181172 RepID=A0ABR3PYL1_9TREE
MLPAVLLLVPLAAAAPAATVDSGIVPDVQGPGFNFSTTGTYVVPGAGVHHTLPPVLSANATAAANQTFITIKTIDSFPTAVLITTTDAWPSSASSSSASAGASQPKSSATPSAKNAADALRPAALVLLVALAAVIAI